MQLTFLGTSSGGPTRTRNVAGLAVRDGRAWDLFDCGEGTQHQLLDSNLSLAQLRRVFISHLHGDHCFGIFGLLASRAEGQGDLPLDIFGPEGLEEMVWSVLDASDTQLNFPVTFHTVPSQGVRVVDTPSHTIDALPLDHRVTCFGWWIREADRPGAFDPDRATELGLTAGPLYTRLLAGESVTTADGTVIHPSEVVGQSRPGRSLIVAGDNRDPATLLGRTGPVQLLVHEATYTEDVVADAGEDRGHSTAARVAAAAQAAGVDNLILTHFSARYRGIGAHARPIDDIRQEAQAHYRGALFLAEDYAMFEFTADGLVRRDA